MANYATLKAAINAVIRANGNKEITGTVLNETLTAMVNSLGADYQFAGVATPSTNPGTPDQNVFYLAGQAGTYTNFNSIVLPDGVTVLKWNGSWSSETVVAGDGVFDISAYKATGGTLATFADLSAALDGGNNIPSALRKGGMSVKFVQSSNNYVKFFCTADEFTTDATKWQGVDDEPTANSNNLVKSGGVFNNEYGNRYYQRNYNFGKAPTNLWIGFTAGDDIAIVVEPVTDISQMDIQFQLNYKTTRIIPVSFFEPNKRFYFHIPSDATELIITRYGTSSVDVICNVYAYKGGIDIDKELKIQNLNTDLQDNFLGINNAMVFNTEALNVLSDFNDAIPNRLYRLLLTAGNIPANAPQDYPLNAYGELKTIKVTYSNSYYVLYQRINVVDDNNIFICYWRYYLSQTGTWIEWAKTIDENISQIIGTEIYKRTSYNFGTTAVNVFITGYTAGRYCAVKVSSAQDVSSLGIVFQLSYKKGNKYPLLAILTNNEWSYVFLPADAESFIITRLGTSSSNIVADIDVIQGGSVNELSFNEHKVIHVGTDFTYKKLRDAIEVATNYNGADVIVHSGTYDLASEFASNIAEHRDGVFYGLNLKNGVCVKFMTGAVVVAKVQPDIITQKHFQPFYITGDCTIDGLNIEVENTRYCIHDDMGGTPIVTIRNCNMKNISETPTGSTETLGCFPQCIGGGFGTNKFVTIENCVFHSERDNSTNIQAVSYHNGFNEGDEGKVIISNCYFDGNNFLKFGWHGPSTIISKCVANNNSFGNQIVVDYDSAGTHEQNIEVLDYLNEVRVS